MIILLVLSVDPHTSSRTLLHKWYSWATGCWDPEYSPHLSFFPRPSPHLSCLGLQPEHSWRWTILPLVAQAETHLVWQTQGRHPGDTLEPLHRVEIPLPLEFIPHEGMGTQQHLSAVPRTPHWDLWALLSVSPLPSGRVPVFSLTSKEIISSQCYWKGHICLTFLKPQSWEFSSLLPFKSPVISLGGE